MASDNHAAITAFYDQLLSGAARHLTENPVAGFINMGYFLDANEPLPDACARLTEQVAAEVRDRTGPILDVGCGAGGGTARLALQWPAGQVHGVNISALQLDACRRRVPGAHFHEMPAEALQFPDETFQTVVSIEAACHFDRRQFLTEAMRVLRPGGTIVVADILFYEQPQVFRRALADQEIYRDIAAYEDLWRSVGFDDVVCRDVTDPVWRGFARHCKARALRGLMTKSLDTDGFRRALAFAERIESLPVTGYVIARATKPGD